MARGPIGKKNPFLSLWLSGANAVLGTYSNQMRAAMRRQTNAALSHSTSQWLALWGVKPAKRSRGGRRR